MKLKGENTVLMTHDDFIGYLYDSSRTKYIHHVVNIPQIGGLFLNEQAPVIFITQWNLKRRSLSSDAFVDER